MVDRTPAASRDNRPIHAVHGDPNPPISGGKDEFLGCGELTVVFDESVWLKGEGCGKMNWRAPSQDAVKRRLPKDRCRRDTGPNDQVLTDAAPRSPRDRRLATLRVKYFTSCLILSSPYRLFIADGTAHTTLSLRPLSHSGHCLQSLRPRPALLRWWLCATGSRPFP